MENNNIEFCKEIIKKSEYMEQFVLLNNTEQFLNNLDKLSIIDEEMICKLIQHQYILQQFLEFIKKYNQVRIKELKIDKLIIAYNHICYYLKCFFRIVQKSENLENAFKCIKNSSKIEKACLVKFKHLLKHEERITNVTEIYLYCVTLSLIIQNINNYFEQNLTTNDISLKGFNVDFTNKHDINKNMDNLNKVQKLILGI